MLVQTQLGCRVWGQKPPLVLGRCSCNLLLQWCSFGRSLMPPGRNSVREHMPGTTGDICAACAFLAAKRALTQGTGCVGAVTPCVGWLWQRQGCPCAPPLPLMELFRLRIPQSPSDSRRGQQGPSCWNQELHTCQQHKKKSLRFFPVSRSDLLSVFRGVCVLLESCIKMFLMQQSALLLSPRDRFSDNLFSQHSQLIFI